MFLHSHSDRFPQRIGSSFCSVFQCLYTLIVTDFLKEMCCSFSGVCQCLYTLSVTDFLKETGSRFVVFLDVYTLSQ